MKHMHGSAAGGNKTGGKINPELRRDYRLLPKQFLNKHTTSGGNAWGAHIEIMCLLLLSGKCERDDISTRPLAKPRSYQQAHAVWKLLPLVNRSLGTALFLKRTWVRFSTGSAHCQRRGREALRCFLLLKGKRKNWVAYFRALDGCWWCRGILQVHIKGPVFLMQPCLI